MKNELVIESTEAVRVRASWRARAAGAVARGRAVSWLGPVTATWVATRLVAFLLAWCASWLATRGALHYTEPSLFHGPRPLAVIGGWDGNWYRFIADSGYPTHLVRGHYSRLAFFPLLPALIALVHLSGLSSVVSGLLVANVASLFAFCAVAALTESYFGAEIAQRAAIYLAISPLAFVFAMVYSEGLLLACGFGAAALMLRGRPWLAVPLALACGLSRPTGALIALPLGAIAYRLDRRKAAGFAAAAAPVAGVALFALYALVHTGDASVFLRAEIALGRHPVSAYGLEQVLTRTSRALPNEPSVWLLRDVGTLVITLLLLVYGAWRRFPVSWLIFAFACVIIPAASGSSVSLARFGLVALPAFWALSLLGRHQWFDQAYRIIAPALMGVGMLTVALHWP